MRNERRERLPKEVQKQALLERIAKEYPRLYGDRFLLVDTQTTRLVIDDISCRTKAPTQDDIEALILSCKGWIEVLEARALTITLAQKLDILLATTNPRRSLVVFPGNGARVVRDCLPKDLLNELNVVELPTQRKIAANGAVEGVTILDVTRVRKIASDIKLETLIVLDDVIATGATLIATRKALPVRNIEAFGCALLILSPLQNRKRANTPSGIEGYTSIITPVIYQGTTGIPPLNSLSTLIGSSEKSTMIRINYVENYVENRRTFLEAIKQLQAKVL